MSFGEKLKKLREKHGYSQKELAEKLDMGASTIGQYEIGTREPGFERLKKIKDFFGVDFNFLLEEGEQKNEVDLRSLLIKGEIYFGGEKLSESAVKALLMFLRHYRKED